MLRTRVITAVVLLVLLLGVLIYGGSTGWNIFVLTVLACAFWEWARLGQFKSTKSILYALLGTGICLLANYAFNLQTQGFPLLAIASVFWVAFAPWCLRNVSVGVLGNHYLFGLVGFMLIGAAGLALIITKTHGIVFLLSTIAICFVADIFAYFFGKTFGKRKLAPRISPGKSWEGAVGGAFSVLAISWVVVLLAGAYPFLESTWQVMAFERWHPAVFSFWLLVLSAYSVVGDLFESMLKRRAGLKDSSQLLPGHGGVLDRIDAQLPVLPLAILLVTAISG
ncbi:phosphatidate cytidylyltransferase [Limnobacter parvus]|uniref:Phosphatidate cytidylyltransferase n=1 Tax=Limnobacter parvus TaxID=2939690 RepID=A0ABT1XI58_9BURK|nr:phosphatidate cytidylyltransferase [Limnobacter parvus]MCR2746976.1 phosphatidate cytidylyltransferase [Limnobacter parvus]